MDHGLVSRLSARFVFVVGKGGVGKSTTSSALALAFADRDERTHLLSTDPAHSLGDLFGKPDPKAEEWKSACTPLLSVEEFDASRHAKEWLAEVQAALGELVERGTYLDREDVSALLDGSLPGMDEVMSALRIASLAADAGHQRLVVDTAPTGHTLRLLGGSKLVRGWVSAAGAMAEKASAVALGLTGRRIRLAGELVVERLSRDIDRFGGVLAEADFVVVTREEEVVEAETTKLVRRLIDDGLRVSARVAVGSRSGWSEGAPPTLRVVRRNDLVGCEGLRRWGKAQEGSSEPAASALAAAEPREILAILPARSLMLFSGKGGVGKSTCAAAYALVLGEDREVLLLSTDPAGSLGDVFGRPVGSEGTSIAGGVIARQLDAEAAFARFRESHRERMREVFARLGLRDSVALDRRVLESMVDMAPPGVDEIFALDAILDTSGEPRLLVLDTAPTGHFLRLLEMPEIAFSWSRALLRILLKYRSVLGLDDFAQEVLEFAKRLRSLISLLGDPAKSGVVVVTSSEPLACRETERLTGSLRERGVPMSAVLQNLWSSTDPVVRATGEHEERSVPTILSPLVFPPPVGADRLRSLAGMWRTA